MSWLIVANDIDK